MRFSKKVLAISLASIFIFTIVCFIFEFMYQQDISSSLIDNFFKVMGTEIAALAFMKITESIMDAKVEKEKVKNNFIDGIDGKDEEGSEIQ